MKLGFEKQINKAHNEELIDLLREVEDRLENEKDTIDLTDKSKFKIPTFIIHRMLIVVLGILQLAGIAGIGWFTATYMTRKEASISFASQTDLRRLADSMTELSLNQRKTTESIVMLTGKLDIDSIRDKRIDKLEERLFEFEKTLRARPN